MQDQIGGRDIEASPVLVTTTKTMVEHIVVDNKGREKHDNIRACMRVHGRSNDRSSNDATVT